MTDKSDVLSYLSDLPPDQKAALETLRGHLLAFLPDHVECLSHAMPGLRAPGKHGKMVVGYAAFARHLGLYPHSGNIIPQIDCTPFKTSKSGVLFTPAAPLPLPLIQQILTARRAEIAAAPL
jgi:uncharacterized protein YdhG (YjbR/CyaY superfamily)